MFLLTAAAEIEHALMAQYLYAGYSVRVAGDSAPKLEEIQNLLFQVAREEMGHLATVQNLLHLIGGPLNLNREHSPYASEIYPFRFKLEPLSRDSLAKYVIAESPARLPDDFPTATRSSWNSSQGRQAVQRRPPGPPRRPDLRQIEAALRRGRRRSR